MPQRWLKILLFAALGLLGFVATLLLLTQTRPFKNWLRDQMVAASQTFLHGRLQIGRLDGNLISFLAVHDILLESAGDTVLYLPKLAIAWAPTRLLRKEFVANSLLLDSLYLKLRQLPDSSWNVSHLVSIKPDTAPLGWKIAIDDLQLSHARMHAGFLDTLSMLPRRLDHLNVRASLAYTDSSQRVHLREFRLQAHQPDFVLQELSFRLARNGEAVWLKDFVLRTGRNRLGGEGALELSAKRAAAFELVSAPLDFAELRLALPALRLYGHPQVSVKTHLGGDSLRFDLSINEGDEHLRLYGHVASLETQPRFSVDGDMAKLNLGQWLNDPQLASNLNGVFHLRGSGKEPEKATVKFSADFHDCVFKQQALARMLLQADYAGGDLNGNLNLWGNFGRARLEARLPDVAKSPSFEMRGELEHFNAAGLIPDDTVQTDINLMFAAQGSGFDPEKLRGKLWLNASHSKAAGVAIDTLFGEVSVNRMSYEIDTLWVRSQPLQFHLAGALNPHAMSDLRFGGQLGDLTVLKSIWQADTVAANGRFSGRARGKPDSLLVEASYRFNHLRYDTFAIDTVAGDVRLFRQPDSLQGHATAYGKNAALPGLQLRTVDLRTEFTQDIYHLFLEASTPDSLGAQVEAIVAPDSVLRVAIPALVLNLKKNQWSGGDESMQLLFGKDTYEARNFRLVSGEKVIEANGTISRRGAEHFNLKIADLDIGALAALLRSSQAAHGLLNMNAHIEGTADHPLITGDLAVRDARLNQFAWAGLQGKFDYAGERLSWDLALNLDEENRFTGDGYLPLRVSFATGEARFDDHQPMQLRISTEEMLLSSLQSSLGLPAENVQGKMVGEVKLENTLKAPRLRGFLRLQNGSLKIPKYGVNYDDVQAELELDSTRISIASFQARNDKGLLTAAGYASFDSGLTRGNLKAARLKISTNDFLLAKTTNYEISIKGKVELTAQGKQVQFGGEITVPRASLFLPAFMAGTDTTEMEAALPFLVAATAPADCTKATHAAARKSAMRSSDYFKNLRGTLKLEIPRNTWLRSPNMNVEISGSLDVVKNGPDFELFGYINTQRGNYDFYGKRFEIASGTLTFQGGAGYDPKLQIEADNTLRTADKEKKNLKLEITGKASEPKLQFTLDDEQITEGDAVSYLFFGRSLEELAGGQKSTAGGDTKETQLAQDVAAALVSAQINKALGKSLNVDVFAINAGQSWQQASFVVGKYLTPDLFVSYQKEFGDPKSNEVAPELFTLEYEVTRFLFLQLINGDDKKSGGDIIFKFERR